MEFPDCIHQSKLGGSVHCLSVLVELGGTTEVSAAICNNCPVRNKPAEHRKEVSRGLGDTIAKVTRALGIPTCGGCAERQGKLNSAVPYRP